MRRGHLAMFREQERMLPTKNWPSILTPLVTTWLLELPLLKWLHFRKFRGCRGVNESMLIPSNEVPIRCTYAPTDILPERFFQLLGLTTGTHRKLVFASIGNYFVIFFVFLTNNQLNLRVKFLSFTHLPSPNSWRTKVEDKFHNPDLCELSPFKSSILSKY